jgi:hypothetical protein
VFNAGSAPWVCRRDEDANIKGAAPARQNKTLRSQVAARAALGPTFKVIRTRCLVQTLALELICWDGWQLNWLKELTAGRQFLVDLLCHAVKPAQIHWENVKKDRPDISNREHPHSTGQSSKKKQPSGLPGEGRIK